MFSDLLRALNYKIHEDAFFGTLRWERLIGSAWEGKVTFAPTGKEVTIYIWHLENNKVSKEHYRFYKELEKRYPKIEADIERLLREESDSYHLPTSDFSKYWLKYISFPGVKELQSDSFSWDLDFYSDIKSNPGLSVSMEGWELDREEIWSGD